jgi:hypothetical protein
MVQQIGQLITRLIFALWNTRVSSRQYYLHGPWHRRGAWVEYLRWLQQ